MEKSQQIKHLIELKELFEQGILTKEELEAEKQKILGRIKPATKLDCIESALDQESSQQVEISAVEKKNGQEDLIDKKERFRFNKFYATIIGLIALFFLIAGIIIIPQFQSKSTINTTTIPSKKVTYREPIVLKGHINDKIGFSMRLQFKGNEIEGTEHYDSQKEDAILFIKGQVDDNGVMVLHELDGNVEAGLFKGILSTNSYEGSFINSRNKEFKFTSEVRSEKEMQHQEKELEKAIGDISQIGSIITVLGGKVYYLKDEKPEYGYESQGNNCGKIYIFDVSDKSTTSIPIQIPSEERYSIEKWTYYDLKITIIINDVGRIGGGAVNCTEVCQYNIKTGKWKVITNGCARAKFIESGKRISLTYALITNYEEAECAADYQFEYTNEIVNL